MNRTIARLLLALSLPFLAFTNVHAAGDPDWKPRLQLKLPGKASTQAYSSDGLRLAVGHPDGQVTVWDVKSGTLVHRWAAQTKNVNSVQFFAQDTRLLTIGDENRARLWTTADWTEAGAIEGVAFSGGISPDNRWLAAQDPDQVIRIWDLSTLKPVKQLTEKGIGGTENMTFTADGKYLATAYNDPLLIDLETKRSRPFVNPGDKKTPMKIDMQGNQATFSMGAMTDDDAMTHRVIPSRTGTLVALGRAWYGRPAFVDVWDFGTMKRLGRFKPKDSGTHASFSYDNALLAVDGSTKVTIWKIASGKQIASLTGDGIMQFSPNSMELAVTDGETLIIYAPK